MQAIKTALSVIVGRLLPGVCGAAQPPAKHLIPVIALLAGLLWAPASASASERLSTDGRPASAAVNFSIIIPAVLRVIENKHPRSLPAADTQTSRISALQRIVLVSTLGKGFCMDLQLNRRQIADWQVQLSGSAGARVQASGGGYRVCTSRAGRYELALQHDFSLNDNVRGALAPALDWPVSMSLTAP
ncbi:MAG: hypothetical protein ACYCZ6_05530 [Polaromonas sp.]